jgi:hypothetical protein
LPVPRRARRAGDEGRGRDGRRLFASFAPSTQQESKQLAVGLASAILINATLVRAVLLPTTRGCSARPNWHLPKPRHSPPKLEHEPEVAPARA